MRFMLNQFSVFLLIILLVISAFTVKGYTQNHFIPQNSNEKSYRNNNSYFVQITDTHVLDKTFDKNEISKKRFSAVIENVTSFDNKPAFIVMTGDLVEWGGSSKSGALNYQTLVSCLYELDNQLYADSDFLIPVYTTPGNHDYYFGNNLKNYHLYMDNNYIYDEDRYIITYNDVSLFFMDSGFHYILEPWDWFRILSSGLYNDDIQWLDEELNKSESKYKIILMHHPAVNIRDDRGVMIDVIARNREIFIDLCDKYNVDIVLTGHTHRSRVFDRYENLYNDFPINCTPHSTLFVQTDDCKQNVNYRNISITNNDIWLEETQKLNVTTVLQNSNQQYINYFLQNIIRINTRFSTSFYPIFLRVGFYHYN